MTFFSRFARLSGIIAILVLGAASSAFAFQSAGVRQHDFPVPEVHAVALDEPVILDGRLDESVWRSAPATQRTEVRFAFDDDALYIGARMYDDLGADGVRTRLARRDAYVDGDALTIVFDPYHDHLTRAE